MACRIVFAAIVLLWPVCGFGQLFESGCAGIDKTLEGCRPAAKALIRDIPKFQSDVLRGEVLHMPGFHTQWQTQRSYAAEVNLTL
jgi:hypothetical protein